MDARLDELAAKQRETSVLIDDFARACRELGTESIADDAAHAALHAAKE